MSLCQHGAMPPAWGYEAAVTSRNMLVWFLWFSRYVAQGGTPTYEGIDCVECVERRYLWEVAMLGKIDC